MPDDDQQTWTRQRGAAALTWLVLLIHAGLLLDVARYNCATHDEYWHIPVGLWNATHGQFHYENLNPPLPRVLAAVPLIMAGAETGRVDETADKEHRADAFVAANRDRYPSLVTLARIPSILISVLTGWVLASWAREVFGPGAAVLSAVLWSFSPNVLGHASLVTSDVPAACAMLLTLRCAWKYAVAPSWSLSLLLGLWLGLAQLVKFTCLLAYPLVVAVWWIQRCRNSDRQPQTYRQTLLQWIVLLTLSLTVINAGYLFHGSGRLLKAYQFQSQAMQQIQSLSLLSSLPVPLPADFVEGVDHQRHVMAQWHPVYLDGEWSFEGFRNYYLSAWWYKSPHAIQILLALAVLAVCWPRRERRHLRLQVTLLLPVLLLFFVASSSSMQLGYRYLLPVTPFVFLFAAQLASAGGRRIGMPQAAALAAAIALVATARCHPHYLSYFNERSGGPENAQTHLLDSNLDWGQDLLALRDYVRSNRIENLRLAYFGMVVPTDIGLPYTVPRSDTLTPGWFAISANFVGGRPHTIRNPDGSHDSVDVNAFAWFRWFEPRARIGHSILVYELTREDIDRVTQILSASGRSR